MSGTSAADVTVTEWSKDVVAQVTTVNDATVVGLNGAPAIEGTDVIVLQVDAGTSISTYTLTESFNTSTQRLLLHRPGRHHQRLKQAPQRLPSSTSGRQVNPKYYRVRQTPGQRCAHLPYSAL